MPLPVLVHGRQCERHDMKVDVRGRIPFLERYPTYQTKSHEMPQTQSQPPPRSRSPVASRRVDADMDQTFENVKATVIKPKMVCAANGAQGPTPREPVDPNNMSGEESFAGSFMGQIRFQQGDREVLAKYYDITSRDFP